MLSKRDRWPSRAVRGTERDPRLTDRRLPPCNSSYPSAVDTKRRCCPTPPCNRLIRRESARPSTRQGTLNTILIDIAADEIYLSVGIKHQNFDCPPNFSSLWQEATNVFRVAKPFPRWVALQRPGRDVIPLPRKETMVDPMVAVDATMKMAKRLSVPKRPRRSTATNAQKRKSNRSYFGPETLEIGVSIEGKRYFAIRPALKDQSDDTMRTCRSIAVRIPPAAISSNPYVSFTASLVTDASRPGIHPQPTIVIASSSLAYAAKAAGDDPTRPRLAWSGECEV
ncbi:hypothetical protein B0T14DRAFT_195651 [Immersiella caudata]|uniref:Uncharacterized protein n=1 Tax=Immersiella caudata TaxID=314043 RepID=A0AA39WZB1_9PEZI|nr:hypothetical protein B0T14DRAFT_195651 [Immersiella caudata]